MLISQVNRSGGTLLSQLFDGHPACHVHPGELLLNRPKDVWPQLDLSAPPRRWLDALYAPHLSDYARTTYQHERWTGSRDGIDVTCNIRSWAPDSKTRLEAIRSRLRIEEAGKPPRVQDTHWHFRTYDAAQLRRLLKKVPSLELVACYDFNCDIHSPRELDDTQEDIVLILRRHPNS